MPTAIESAFAPLLKESGFRKSRLTWRREAEAGVLVFNIQRSGWSDGVYINLGVYLRALGPDLDPPESKCHMRARLERVCPPDYFEAVRSATEHETGQPRVVAAARFFGLPWLLSLATPAGIRDSLASKTSGVAVVADVFRCVGVADPIQGA